jgi:NAD(P)-dependent dehydrogenase (short-subunit alcohol dehydrogenase family)
VSNVLVEGSLPSVEQLFSVRDKVAIVTGASSGIGARCAAVLAQAGAHVAWVARRAEQLRSLTSPYPTSIAVPADLAAPEAVERIFTQVQNAMGPPDLLVNAAGRTNVVPAGEERLDDFRSVIDLNLTVPFLMCQAFARSRAGRTGGSIINVASVNAVVASAAGPETSYGASKSGLLGLTRELAYQWAERGIRVNAIGPGYFPTEMTESLFDNDKGVEWLRRRTPMKRGGRLEELDGPLLFLASDASSYVTGQHLLVDGGWTLV